MTARKRKRAKSPVIDSGSSSEEEKISKRDLADEHVPLVDLETDELLGVRTFTTLQPSTSQTNLTGLRRTELLGTRTMTSPESKIKQTNSKTNRKKGYKPPDKIWNEYIVKDGGKRKEAICKVCDKKVSAEAPRLKKHKEKCKRADERSLQATDSQPMADIDLVRESVGSQGSGSNSQSLVLGTGNTPEKKQVQASIRSYTSTMNPARQNKLDTLLGKFMFSTNSAFRIAENPEFLEFVRCLCPTYIVPSRRVIGGSLLNCVYNEIEDEIKEQLTGKDVIIQQDGWSTNQNEPVIAHFIKCTNNSYLIHVDQPGTASKTAEYCCNLLLEQIQSATEKYGCNVIGCVTDNNNTMQLLRRMIVEQLPHIYAYGCNAHLFNLVGKDFSDTDLTSKVVSIQQFFRNNHYASASLLQKGGLRPKIPNATRWNSNIHCLQSYIKNQSKYLEVSRELVCAMPVEMKILVQNNSFYARIQEQVKIANPIAAALGVAQKENSNLGDSVSQWINVERKIGSAALEERFTNRRDLGMTDVALAAYTVDPRYRGDKLSDTYYRRACDWICDKSPIYLMAVTKLKTKDENTFPKSYFDEKFLKYTEPHIWWESLSDSTSLPRGFAKFAAQLTRLCCSSAGIERSFKTLKNTITDNRNRLGVGKAQRLCMIQQYFQQINSNSEFHEREDESGEEQPISDPDT